MGRKKKIEVNFEERTMLTKLISEKDQEAYFDALLAKKDSIPFRFDESKLAIYTKLCARLLDGRYSSSKNLARGILKSYILDNKGKIPKTIEGVNIGVFAAIDIMSISNAGALIVNFLNEKCLTRKVENEPDDINECLARVVALKMEEIFGDIIYVDLSQVTYEDFKSQYLSKLSDLGYENTFAGFFVSKIKLDPQVRKEYQPLILQTYVKVVNEYVSTLKYMENYMSQKEKAQFKATVVSFLSNLKERMTETTKNSLDVKIADEKFEIAYCDIKDECEVADYNYLKNLRTALENRKSGSFTAQDEAILDDFYNQIVKTNHALSIKDKDGRACPANYFLYMKVPLNNSVRKPIFKALRESGYLKEKGVEPLNALEEKLKATAGIFTESQLKITDKAQSVNGIFEKYKGSRIVKFDGTVVSDLTNEENFEKFKETVCSTMKKYKLPKTSECYGVVCDTISRGRRAIKVDGNTKNQDRDK